MESREAGERPLIAAEVFLRALSEHGVDFFFANPGTDFPPIVEAYARAACSNAKLPRPILVPHENLAIAMAHGATLMTGRPQAVMVHVNVGTANTINNLANLARDNVPLILCAGRTPITETGRFGSRNRPIHWAQEMFDQAGMVRELVKWDYELRAPEQVSDVVARAAEIATTSPQGPVYLVLPREPLSAPLAGNGATKPRATAAAPSPDPLSVAALARWIADAERPLIVTAAAGRDHAAVAALAGLCDCAAIPAVSFAPRTLCLPSSHPMHAGFDPAPLLQQADLVITIECDVPWIPSLQTPPDQCRVVHIAHDPAFTRYPMRSFPSDLSIAATPKTALEAIESALTGELDPARVAARKQRIAEQQAVRRARLEQAAKPSEGRITPEHLSRAIADTIGPEAIIFNEYPLALDHCPRELPGTYFGLSPAGGLGWGLGAALGAKLAAPGKFVVATIGDGAYLFSNPVACHWFAHKHGCPVMTIVFNNERYGAVRRATMSMFKDGAAGAQDGRFLAELAPSPRFEEIAVAQDCHAERVEQPDQLFPALARARDAVLRNGRQSLLNVMCPY